MIHLNVLLTVKAESDIPRVKEFLAEAARRSRPEPGCERFEVYHSQNDARVFLLVEWWTDAAAVAAHREGDTFKHYYSPNVLPLVERVPHPSDRVA